MNRPDRETVEIAGWIAIVWLIYLGVAISFFGTPETVLGWMLLLFLGPIVILFAEILLEGAFALVGATTPFRQLGEWYSTMERRNEHSASRIGFLLAAGTLLILVTVLVLARTSVGG